MKKRGFGNFVAAFKTQKADDVSIEKEKRYLLVIIDLQLQLGFLPVLSTSLGIIKTTFVSALVGMIVYKAGIP